MLRASEVFFDSGGVRCAADLYLPPDAAGPVPCVVMGHGASGTKRLGLPAYAEKFADGGIAVLAFDYRGFGASDGEPRQVIDVEPQRADYRAAVRCARSLDTIDPLRVALWGTSLSGGHVIAVAAGDPTVAAVVCQAPLIDGLHRGLTGRHLVSREVARRTLGFAVAAARDVVNARRGTAPYLVPVVAPPGQVAAFTDPDARAAFEAFGGEATGWRNEIAPRFAFALPRYVPGTAERLAMPLLMCVADRDQEASGAYAARVGAQAPWVEIRHFPCTHFEVYRPPAFDRISGIQLEFLRAHLLTRAPATTR